MTVRFGLTTVEADGSITIMAAGPSATGGGLSLDGQSPWFFYNAVDAPEGAWDYYGSSNITASFTLPVNLSVGTWYIFAKYLDYDAHHKFQFTLGSDTSDQITKNYRTAGTGRWNGKNALTVTTPGNTLVLHIDNNAASDAGHLLQGLYLTKDNNVLVLENDLVTDLNYPTVMDDSPAVKGNLIRNSGFECGVDGMQWGFDAEGGGRTVPLTGMWDNTQGWEGASCIKVLMDSATRLNPANTTDRIIHKATHLKDNKQYTFSCYMKASSGHSFIGSVQAWNTFVPPSGYTAQHHIDGTGATVNSSGWTRVSVTGYLLKYPSCDYNFMVNISGPDGTYVLVDGVQLEEGSLTAYAPAADMEAGVLIDQSAKPGNIYFTTDTIQATLKARNHLAQSQTQRLHYEIYDHMNNLVRSGIYNLTGIAATTTYTDSAFDISTGGKTGIFRLITWIEGMDKTEREICYSVIPPTTTSADATSYLGIHPNFYDTQLAAIQRLGIKWARALSPETTGRWSDVEPSDDTFNFYDSKIDALQAKNITPMVTLGTNNFWPSWADNSGLPNLTKWAQFCGNHTPSMVQHYSPDVKYWEIWNEPLSSDTPFDAAFYAQMLHDATDAILASDATAKIIAMGGLPPAGIQAVIDQLAIQYPAWDWQSKFTAMATHDYIGGVNPEDLTSLINTYGVPIWNTETGLWDRGFYQFTGYGFVAWGKTIWPHELAQQFYRGCVFISELVKNFVRTIGSKQTGYFYYDSRYYADPVYFDQHTSIWEMDGSIRSKGVAYAIAGSLIDHATSLGNASPDGNSYMYVFDTGGTNPVASLCTKDFTAKQITISLSAGQFEVLDLMGNVFSTSTVIPYGRIPIWIRGLGISASTLNSAISGGTVASRSDTVAPNVTIQEAPRGPLVSGSPFRVRYVGIDDQSYPNLGEINPETNAQIDTPDPEAILYSYRLSPYQDWSAWTARTLVDYSNIPNGRYTFEVKAKDQAGNTSSIAARSIQLGATVVRRSALLLS